MTDRLTPKIIQVLSSYVSSGICDDEDLRPAVEITVAHNALMAAASLKHKRLTELGEFTDGQYRDVIATLSAEKEALKADLKQQRSIVAAIAERKFGPADSESGLAYTDTQARLDLALHSLSRLLTLLSPLFSGEPRQGLVELSARELREAFNVGATVLNDTCDRTSMAAVANLAFRSSRLAMVALDSASRLLPNVQPETGAELDDRTVFNIASAAAGAAYMAAISAADSCGDALSADPAETATNSYQLFAGTPTKGTA